MEVEFSCVPMEKFANLMSTAAYTVTYVFWSDQIIQQSQETARGLVDSPRFAIEVALHTLPRSHDGQ